MGCLASRDRDRRRVAVSCIQKMLGCCRRSDEDEAAALTSASKVPLQHQGHNPLVLRTMLVRLSWHKDLWPRAFQIDRKNLASTGCPPKALSSAETPLGQMTALPASQNPVSPLGQMTAIPASQNPELCFVLVGWAGVLLDPFLATLSDAVDLSIASGDEKDRESRRERWKSALFTFPLIGNIMEQLVLHLAFNQNAEVG